MNRSILLFACLCGSAVAQQAGSRNSVLLDASHPSVFLQYDHGAERQTTRPGEVRSEIWLRIHNNTRGAICIRTQNISIGDKVAPLTLASGKHVLGIRDGVVIAPLYSVEQEHETSFDRLPLAWHGDVFAVSWVSSGGTVLMSLPKKDLVKGRRVVLPFSYEWEADGDGIAHDAYFYSRQAPK
jgi:hypothetical protein